MKNLQRVLKNYREKYDINQTKLAELLGVSRQSITDWENDRSKPRTDMYNNLAEFFDVSIDYLLDYTDTPKPIVHETLPQPPKPSQNSNMDFLVAFNGAIEDLPPDTQKALKENVLNFVKILKEEQKSKKGE